MEYTAEYIKEANDYLDSLDVTDNELIRVGCTKYPEDIVQALVYSDNIDQVIADFS